MQVSYLIGIGGEDVIADKLRSLGFHITPTGPNDPYDFIVRADEYTYRVEAKTATRTRHGDKGWRYQARIRNHDCDVIVWLCQDPAGNEVYYILPASAVIGLSSLTIYNQDPAKYRGKWVQYRDNWAEFSRPLIEF